MGDRATRIRVERDEHDLVADVLDDAAVVRDGDVEGACLEVADEGEQCSRVGSLGERGEPDQVHEPDGQTEQRAVQHVRLGGSLPVDGVREVVGEDHAHRVAEPQRQRGGVGDAHHPLEEIRVGRVHRGLDGLDVEGDRRLGHTGERVAEHPEELVGLRAHRLELQGHRGEGRVLFGEHAAVFVRHGHPEGPPESDDLAGAHLREGRDVRGGQRGVLGEDQVGRQAGEAALAAGGLDLVNGRTERLEERRQGVVARLLGHDQTLPSAPRAPGPEFRDRDHRVPLVGCSRTRSWTMITPPRR